MSTPTLEAMKQAHRTLAEFRYDTRPVERGYANRTLYVNLTGATIRSKPVTEEMKHIFTGGRGFALWLLWNAVSGDTRWDDPENELIIANGPICGTLSYPGTGKSTVVTLSPLTHSALDSNVGGMFGPLLKGAGWDALEIQGKADRDVVIVIDGDTGRVTIEEAPLEEVNAHILTSQLTEMYATSPLSPPLAEGKEGWRNLSVVTAGRGAEHTFMGCLNLSWYDVRREEPRCKQAGRGGAGSVFRDKGLKGIVVRATGWRAISNNPANPELIRRASARINKEIADLDDQQNQIRRVGTPYLVEIMNDYDLLPVQNFRYGSHPETHKIASTVWKGLFTQDLPDGCHYGCTLSCSHGVDGFRPRTGPYKGQTVLVDGPEYETVAGVGANLAIFDPDAIMEINFYCDTYGIDTISFGTSMAFVMECYQEGILNKERTGGLELTWGNADAVLEVLHQMARGEGFGLIVGQGTRRMKHIFAQAYNADPQFLQDIGMEVKGLEFSEYIPKESLAQQGGYAIANKGPQHDEAWLIFMDMVNNQIPTFEDKAEALHYFPLWRTWFSLHGLCKLPWNDITPTDNATTDEPQKVPQHVENYTWLYEGLTGIPITPDGLILQSERVFNFQRVFNLKMGFGTREHDYPPYRAVGPVTTDEYESRAERYDEQLREELGVDPGGLSTEEKMALLRRHREEQYEWLLNAVYKRRGWTKEAIPTLETLRRLEIDLPDVIAAVQRALGEE